MFASQYGTTTNTTTQKTQTAQQTKTNSNIKRVYFMKKKLISFCIVQVVIFVVFATLFYQSRPFNNSECKDTIIIVENSEYTAVFREYEFRIYNDKVRATSTIRISLSYVTTNEEINKFLKIFKLRYEQLSRLMKGN